MTVLGAVLAGGLGRRIGGDKALVALEGRPLLSWPLAALRAAGIEEVAVVAKRETALPPGLTVWLEPDEPRHPLTGLVHALRGARGRAVLACAADLALLDEATVRRVLAAAQHGDVAVVPSAGGRLQPLCALYAPAALEALQHFDPRMSLTAAVEALGPRVAPFDDETPFFNVNSPEDLLQASALLSRRSRSSSAPAE
ncbi:MAG TPA: molybdenum cofactor guanylyltransferase [Solirubrobacteraceae bacterium]